MVSGFGGGEQDLAQESPKSLTFVWGWSWGLGRQQHMGMRIPGILASEKVAVVTRVATGLPGQTGVLHAVDAEHCPEGRERRPSRIFSPC